MQVVIPLSAMNHTICHYRLLNNICFLKKSTPCEILAHRVAWSFTGNSTLGYTYTALLDATNPYHVSDGGTTQCGIL